MIGVGATGVGFFFLVRKKSTVPSGGHGRGTGTIEPDFRPAFIAQIDTENIRP